MRTCHLHIGDRIEANVRGVSFKATIVGTPPGLLAIDPDQPKRVTHRFVKARQVVRKLEAQQKLGAGRPA
jgi:hypothetical protein